MIKGLGNIGGLLKQAKEFQKELERIKEDLKNRVVEGSAGGGMVTVQVNGHQELLSVKIEPEVVNSDDVEMLEDLVLAAVTQGMEKSRALAQEEMAKLTGGMNLPGLSGLLEQL